MEIILRNTHRNTEKSLEAMESTHDFPSEHFITGSKKQKCCGQRTNAPGKLWVLEWVLSRV